ncbi:MAG: hypothetical protein FWG02_00920 [Holophagaceae bacterium]|nr:hypothetical protein [Holophagaceae bacterium]
MKNNKYCNLAEILPHEQPMILIDRVLSYDLEKMAITTQFDVTEKSLFYNEALRGIPPYIGLECMVQSMGALSGISNKEKNEWQGKPKLGFLLGTRKYTNSVETYKAGATYTVESKELFNDGTMGSYECTIKAEDDSICAMAEVIAFSPKNPEDFIEGNGANG